MLTNEKIVATIDSIGTKEISGLAKLAVRVYELGVDNDCTLDIIQDMINEPEMRKWLAWTVTKYEADEPDDSDLTDVAELVAVLMVASKLRAAEFGRKGGRARARRMSKKSRSDGARKAAAARWGKAKSTA